MTFSFDLGALGGSLLGGVASIFGQSSANRANARLAQQQMEFQERMANTAYQRAMADMKAAGLNPMLAFSQGGAPAPSGQTARMENVAKDLEPAIRGGIQSALAVKQTDANVQVAESQATLNSAKTAETQASTDAIRAATIKTGADTEVAQQLVKKTHQEIEQVLQNTNLSIAQQDVAAMQIREIQERIHLIKAQTGTAQAEARIKSADAALADLNRALTEEHPEESRITLAIKRAMDAITPFR